jgi:alpha-tubulin suppressor-like RCC1 family protein
LQLPGGEVYSWGFSANYRTELGTEDPVQEAIVIENNAVKEKKLTFTAWGGQFSVWLARLTWQKGGGKQVKRSAV